MYFFAPLSNAYTRYTTHGASLRLNFDIRARFPSDTFDVIRSRSLLADLLFELLKNMPRDIVDGTETNGNRVYQRWDFSLRVSKLGNIFPYRSFL